MMKNNLLRGRSAGLLRCHTCGKIAPATTHQCQRCSHSMSLRIPNSFRNTCALLIAALLLYIPANTLPMFIFHKLGSDTPNTIMGGIMILFNSGMYSIAAIVFTASMVIPIFKIIGLSTLLIATRYCSPAYIRHHMWLYRLIERIGRWSMLDVFVISVMLTLLNFAPFVTITIDWGTSAFGAVVILTMLAAITFDPRLLWDAIEKKESQGECTKND